MNLITNFWKYLTEPIPLVQPDPKQNIITDYLKQRGERLIALRNKAIEDKNIWKKKQADYLINEVNHRISERFSFNNFQF